MTIFEIITIILLIIVAATSSWLRLRNPSIDINGHELDTEFWYIILVIVQVVLALIVIFN